MIPKILHHIWVGDKPLPKKSLDFIELSKSLHPGFEFMFWSEQNLQTDNRFVAWAYQNKLWAFVSDYHRFKILYEYGGIYTDTDIEMLRSLEPLSGCSGFAGMNREEDSIYCGVIGAIPKHPLIKKIIEVYDNLLPGQRLTSPMVFTKAFMENAHKDFTIYPYSYFYPVNEGEKPLLSDTENAYTIHHWDESWRSFVPLRRFLRHIGIIKLYHKIKRKNASISYYSNR